MEKIRDLLNRKRSAIFAVRWDVPTPIRMFLMHQGAFSNAFCISFFAPPYIPSILNTAVNDNLPIHEEKNRGVYVKGLFEVYVSSISEIHEVMRRGGNSRMVAYTSKSSIYCVALSCRSTDFCTHNRLLDYFDRHERREFSFALHFCRHNLAKELGGWECQEW